MKTSYWPILNIPEGVAGDFSIRHRRYRAGHEFVTATPRTTILAGQKAKTVQFKRSVRYHELYSKKQGTWMVDVPVEQAQANAIIHEYQGEVLVGGLGIGYAATRIALNPAVQRVVVVEIAPEVIALVAPHLPEKARKKMVVVEADLLKYLQQNATAAYDHAFYDIWQSDGEGTFFDTVVPLLQATRCVHHQPDCWNEDVMRGQLSYSIQCSIRALTQPLPGAKALTLEELCTKKGTIWWDWAVPFFQWYREQDASDVRRIGRGVGCYTQVYGRPIFKAAWPAAVEHGA